jgi:hypothetical protein
MSSSRSGSTALALALGAYQGAFNGGELRNLAMHGLSRRGQCGCNTPVRECSFWSEVAQRSPVLTEAWNDPSVEVANQSAYSRTRHFHKILKHGLSKSHLGHISHIQYMTNLYAHVADVSGAQVVVDASKNPVGAAELLTMDDFEPFFLHLVRDPRGVVHSVSNPKVQDGDPSGRLMSTETVARTAATWDIFNLQAEAVARRRPDQYLRIRYEELAAKPEEVLANIWRLISQAGHLSQIPAAASPAKTNHTAWGNPIRAAEKTLVWKLDDRWTRDMPSRSRRVTSLMTWPLRRRYGYSDSRPVGV